MKKSRKPVMNPAAVVQGDTWRIGVITESLLRLEWSDTGHFEDHPTQMVATRDFGETPAFTVSQNAGLLSLDTAQLHVSYDMKPFSKEGLSIVVKGLRDSQRNTWNYGDEPRGNLKGTARTLDEVDGPTTLENGVLSRDGWAVLDDSHANLVADTSADPTNPFDRWVEPRTDATSDLYFFGYGHRYRRAIADFYRLTGPTPLIPRFALGNWWSRYHAYSQQEYLDLMDRFAAEKLPFTTAVMDMDWHRVGDVDPRYGSGWTGYTWNTALFPDPEGFLTGLHERGLKTTLNLHPRDGIRAFEKDYPIVAAQMGIDPATGETVEFDLTNPRFMRAYFDLHHRLEDEGVDFWWIDWQQGGSTRLVGLDPLWMLNFMHFHDSARGDRRPITFSRYAGPGSHRFPVGFSGDTVVTWKSLQFQPYFTATASNIGYGWWSHDIGGHMFGYRDEELQARWYQLGTFSPINRLHSTNSDFNGKEPWNFKGEVRHAMTAALQLRHRLIPYLYTMNWRNHEKDLPLVEPLYWRYPELDDAYSLPNEFFFGTQLLAAPITQPRDHASQMAKADVWLPQGTWFDVFTGRRYEASAPTGRRVEAWRPLSAMPVFAPAGGIIPMLASGGSNDIANPAHLEVVIFPGDNGTFTLVEDDGKSEEDLAVSHTDMLYDSDGSFTISPVSAQGVVPEERSWTLKFRGVKLMESSAAGGLEVRADSDVLSLERDAVRYDTETLTLSVEIPKTSTKKRITVRFKHALEIADDPILSDAFDVLYRAEMLYTTKERAMECLRTASTPAAALASLGTLEKVASPTDPHDWSDSHLPQSVLHALTEVLTRGL